MQTRMNNKKRLFEVFGKVTGVQLHEQEGMSQEQWDDFSDSVEYGIKDHFKRDGTLFKNGVPRIIRDTIWEVGELELTLMEGDDDIQLVSSIQDQIQYVANYETTVNNIPVIVRLPFAVSVEQNHTGNGVEFYTKIINIPEGIEVDVGK